MVVSKQVRRKERNKFVAFYVSDEEKECLVKNAMLADMSISDYCRKTLFEASKIRRADAEDYV